MEIRATPRVEFSALLWTQYPPCGRCSGSTGSSTLLSVPPAPEDEDVPSRADAAQAPAAAPTPELPPRFQTVVVGVDFSEAARAAVAQAAQIAALDRSELHLLHVFFPPWWRLHYRAPTVYVAPESQREYRAKLKARLAALVAPFDEQLRGLSVRCQLQESRSAAFGIVTYAREKGADLVVLGSPRTPGWWRALVGSTADGVLRAASFAVLVVRPSASDADLRPHRRHWWSSGSRS